MEIGPSGEISIQFAHNCILSAENDSKMAINWIEGSLKYLDIFGYEFGINERGQTEIKSPEQFKDDSKISFGGPKLKEILNSEDRCYSLGNSPRLYAVSPDGQESYILQRDVDLLPHFHAAVSSFAKVIEQPSHDSIAYAITNRIHIEGLDRTPVQYLQVINLSYCRQQDIILYHLINGSLYRKNMT